MVNSMTPAGCTAVFKMGSYLGLTDFDIICWRLRGGCCKTTIWFPGFCTNVFNVWFECELFIYSNGQDFLWLVFITEPFTVISILELFLLLFSNRINCVFFVCLCLSSIFGTTPLLYLDPIGVLVIKVLCCCCFTISCSCLHILIQWMDV